MPGIWKPFSRNPALQIPLKRLTSLGTLNSCGFFFFFFHISSYLIFFFFSQENPISLGLPSPEIALVGEICDCDVQHHRHFYCYVSFPMSLQSAFVCLDSFQTVQCMLMSSFLPALQIPSVSKPSSIPLSWGLIPGSAQISYHLLHIPTVFICIPNIPNNPVTIGLPPRCRHMCLHGR